MDDRSKIADWVSTEMTCPEPENEKIETLYIFWAHTNPYHCFYEPT